MTLSKTLATLAILFAILVHKSLARYQAALVCEHGGIRTEIRSSQIYPCFSSSYSCTSSWSASDYYFPGSRWDQFRYMKMYHIYCDGSSPYTGMCRYSGGNYYFTDSCPGGHESNMFIVADYQRRRQLRGKRDGNDSSSSDADDSEKIPDFDGPEMEVEIDGQMFTLLNPDYGEE